MAAVPASSGWANRTWQLEDGLPDSSVTSIGQTADGNLWVGTLGGLVRFDGVEFHNQFLSLDSQTVQSMLVDQSDRLWLAMDRGPVVCLEKKEYREYAMKDGLPNAPLRTLTEAGDGSIWIASLSDQVSRIKDNRVTNFDSDSGIPHGGEGSVARDNSGQLWLCKSGKVGFFQAGRFQEVLETHDVNAFIASARSGGIWLYADNSLFKSDKKPGFEKWESLPLSPDSLPKVILEDHTGAVWLGTAANGLFHCDSTNCERVPTSHPQITCLTEDHEGNIWAGTGGGGLNRLRPRILELLDRDTGLPFDSITSICQDRSNALWIATENGSLLRRMDSRWISMTQSNELVNVHSTCVASDPHGGVWIGTSGSGLFRYRDGKLSCWNSTNGLANDRVRSLLVTARGDLWLATFWPTHLQLLRGGKWQTLPLPPGGDYAVRAMSEDNHGNIWLGCSDGKLIKIDSVTETTTLQREGDSIRCLYCTSDGSLWIGHAHIGIELLKDGHYTGLSTKEGLCENSASQILPDNDGWLWVAGTHGIFRIQQRESQAVALGRASRVHSVAYGSGEGLANLQANFDFFPGAQRGRDGFLWFPMRSGLLKVSAGNSGEDRKPLVVHLEEVLVDDQPAARLEYRMLNDSPDRLVDLSVPAPAIVLSPSYHKLKFNFTALSFIAPDQINFRYRLEGVDEDWVEAGGQRTATYAKLSPGIYKFRVAACNDVGVWNESTTSLLITVRPFFWQTWWFFGCSVTAFAGAVAIGARTWSTRRLRRRLAIFVQQQALEKERARIARDLHDDLGANLTQIGFATEELQEIASQDVEISKQASSLRERIHDLARDLDAVVWTANPKKDSLNELVAYLSQYFLESFRATQIRTRLEIDDELPIMIISPDARHHLFLAAKEAMNNLMKHSCATEARLKMSVLNGIFSLTLEDNGLGFSLSTVAASKRHGLRNIKARVEEIGGNCEISSTPGKGTSIRINVPLTNYQT